MLHFEEFVIAELLVTARLKGEVVTSNLPYDLLDIAKSLRQDDSTTV
jgi:hypothetical protein